MLVRLDRIAGTIFNRPIWKMRSVNAKRGGNGKLGVWCQYGDGKRHVSSQGAERSQGRLGPLKSREYLLSSSHLQFGRGFSRVVFAYNFLAAAERKVTSRLRASPDTFDNPNNR